MDGNNLPTHLLFWQPLLLGHPESLLHPITQTKLSHTSPFKQSSSRRQSGLQTPVTISQRSLLKHPISEEHTGRQAFSMQVVPGEQPLFSVQGSAGVRTQATLAVGLGTKPIPHEQLALWLDTVHKALGPQGESRHGFTQRLSRQDSLALQSSSPWQPNKHML